MAATYWIKLYYEVLDDPKMGRLPDHVYRRAIEMFLMAGNEGNGGYLPSVQDMAWRLHTTDEDITACLETLATVNIVTETPDGWLVTHFSDRQDAASNAERQAEYRKRKQKATYYGDEPHNEGVTKRNTDIDKDIDKDKDKKKNHTSSQPSGPQPDFANMTPLEAKNQPGISQFCAATGRYPPRAQLEIIWRDCHDMTVDQMRPAWEEWVRRGYNVSGLGWLEWARDGIPVRAVRAGPSKKAGKMSDDEFRAAMEAETARLEREGL